MVLHAVLWLVLSLTAMAGLSYAGEGADEHAPSITPDLSSLNVRLSSRAIQPPAGLVKKVVVLEGIRAAKPLTGEPTRAAILEDDERHRVIVLSAPPDNADHKAGGQIRAYLLQDLDLESRLPQLTACSNQRRCAEDRTPGVGGLGCIAFCLVETLRP